MSASLRTLSILLAGTALAWSARPAFAGEQPGETSSLPEPADRGEKHDEAGAEAIVVTGSRIRGAHVAAEVIALDRLDIAAAGQVDLGEAVRSLPQNFGGGQNPGIGTGAGLANSNVNSAANVNLRGLGPDATLTLLNGHRLPYDAAFGGVDISAIPLAAVERIEVLPDGASAIYGSDAVAGVVNVVLRRDYDGVATSTQLASSTGGGNSRWQADLVAGRRWAGGGIVLAYDHAQNSAIAASQRGYAATLDPASSLYPRLNRHALTLSAHHNLGGVILSLDALYARRTSQTVGGTAAARYYFAPRVESFTLAPAIEVPLGGDWRFRAAAALGRDQTDYATTYVPAAGSTVLTEGCFCNRATSIEAGLEGPLFSLAGGKARLALGGGSRSNGMRYSRIVGGASAGSFDVSRSSRFAYAEINLPFVAPENGVTGIARLNLSGALRYEDYPGMAHLASPRLGLSYAPISDLTLRASWSRSFKAPTLYQQYVPYQTYLLPAAPFGAGPAGTTVFYASGGNPGLKPERARSWTAGLAWRPGGIPGLAVEATWFDIRYRDRVMQPIAGSIAAAFGNPGFASLIDFSPDAQQLGDLVAGSQFGLQNFSGGAYNPALVAALVDNRNINVAVQSISGVDARIAWHGKLGADRELTFDLAGTWLESDQQLTPALPAVQLAGTLFNPPKVRLRATTGYRSGDLALHAALNYTGALADRRTATPRRLAPSATVDLGLRYSLLPGDGAEPALGLSLTVTNLLDASPEAIATTGPTDTPYDSTNFSPIGRFVAIGITRRW